MVGVQIDAAFWQTRLSLKQARFASQAKDTRVGRYSLWTEYVLTPSPQPYPGDIIACSAMLNWISMFALYMIAVPRRIDTLPS